MNRLCCAGQASAPCQHIVHIVNVLCADDCCNACTTRFCSNDASDCSAAHDKVPVMMRRMCNLFVYCMSGHMWQIRNASSDVHIPLCAFLFHAMSCNQLLATRAVARMINCPLPSKPTYFFCMLCSQSVQSDPLTQLRQSSTSSSNSLAIIVMHIRTAACNKQALNVYAGSAQAQEPARPD